MRYRSSGSLALLLALEVAAIAGLHALGSQPWTRLTFDNPAWRIDDAVLAITRLVAMTLAYYLLMTTALYVWGAVRAVDMPDWIALPIVRHIVDKALAATIVVSAATAALPTTGPAQRPVAEAEVPSPLVFDVEPDGRLAPPGIAILYEMSASPSDPEGAAPEAGSTTDSTAVTTPVGPTSTPGPSPSRATTAVTYVVVAGDNLWTIARNHLEAVHETDLYPDDIAPYWRELIDLNCPSLISGDPDLIYPGEIITLPEVRS